jgi:phenylalanyl-tRNA synthetase alpha chain
MCEGRGCPVCKHSGWLEISGAGMVDPAVFEQVGYDPELWTGYAFGMGVERIAMIRHAINDIRLLYENDMRFLAQF